MDKNGDKEHMMDGCGEAEGVVEDREWGSYPGGF